IAPSGDPKNRTFAVDVTPVPATTPLLPGMFVTVTVNAVEHQGVLAVPTQAIIERAGKFYVYVVDRDIAKLVSVTVGLSDGKLSEISGAVQPGAQVIVQGQDQLADGDHVTVVGQ
ncbi:MAG TPA: hypothetical protein VKX96_07700, partial [Chloroflexota bacterium]|nr:hypothetical protein [Chloroflexota bacterium]